MALSSVNFKCTYKHDLMMVPGIGSCLWFAGHIPVNRHLKDGGMWSGKESMRVSKEWVDRGQPLLVYAEGTRKTTSEDGARLGKFKPGGFVTAQRCQIPVVPVTLSGARFIFPPSSLPQLGFGDVEVTIHPPIAPSPLADTDVTPVMDAAHKIINSALRSPVDDLPKVVLKAHQVKKE